MKFNALRNGVAVISCLLLTVLVADKFEVDEAKTFTGRYRVVDGDSLALGKTRFRLLGIDAPELSQTCTRSGQSWQCGAEAKQSLASLSSGDLDCKGRRRDKYGRQLVTCFRGELNVNRELVLRGMAVSFGDYEAEERRAREAHAGVWAGDFARPGEWRRSHKAGFEDEAPHMPSFLRQFFGGES